MPHDLANLSPVAIAGLIVAYLMAASRIAGPLTPLWERLPSPWPQVVPAIVALLPQVADAFQDVNTWESFAISVATAIGLVLPGIKPKPPGPPPGTKGRDGTVIPPGPLTEDTPPSLPGVHPYRFAVLALLVLGCGPALSTKRCDFQNPAYSLEETKCRQRIESTCLLNPDGTPVKSCPALIECEAWRKRECQ